MSPDHDTAFVELCTRLRALGATSVRSGDREAHFTATMPKAPQRQSPELDGSDQLDRFPKRR